MDGHGWVHPRDDGAKMRCGGPHLCRECAEDARVAGFTSWLGYPLKVDQCGEPWPWWGAFERDQAPTCQRVAGHAGEHRARALMASWSWSEDRGQRVPL